MEEIVYWLHHDMRDSKWYDITRSQYDKIKEVLGYLPEDIEITFSNDYSKVRKTIWKLTNEKWRPI